MPTSPMSGVRPPFTLPSNVVLFHDWRYVDHGYLRWLDEKDEPIHLMPPPDPLPAIHSSWVWVPRGVRLETMPGQLDSEPSITAAQLKSPICFGGNVVEEQGRYLLFYSSFDKDSFSPAKQALAGFDLKLCYAQSDDGRNWKWNDNNVVFDPGSTGFHGGCVFVDPSSIAQRYKSVFLGVVSDEQWGKYRERYPEDIDPMAVLAADDPRRGRGAAFGLFGATSPDGLHWTKVEEPLLVQHSDTLHAARYDMERGKYVIYMRTWLYGRRAVGRSESDTFSHFPAPDQILWSDGALTPDQTWYSPGYNLIPDCPDYHLLFPTLWSQSDDGFTPFLFSSPDGLAWSRTPGEILPPYHDRPAWCRCGAFMGDMVSLPGNRVGSLVGGLHIPHKYPRAMPFGQAGWMSWPKDRLVALRSDRDGAFALLPLDVQGREVVLNFRTRIAGSILVEVCGVEGRSSADCDVICGDETSRKVTWKGNSDIGHREGEPVQLKFRMNNADLFSVRFL